VCLARIFDINAERAGLVLRLLYVFSFRLIARQ
jgi:hypothetical protein